MKGFDVPAVILCGGKGLRLRPLTDNTPKPLIKIHNKPILYYIIKQLQKNNIKEFIIATGYKSKKIEGFMKKEFKNLKYKIVNSGNASILKRIKDCLSFIPEDFFLCYGDTISDINLKKIEKNHREEPFYATITSYPINIPFGVMKINKKGIVNSFVEKPILNEVMNIGYFYFTKETHKIIKQNKSLIEVIKYLIKLKKLKSYMHKGIHITINTVAELEYANKNITKVFK